MPPCFNIISLKIAICMQPDPHLYVREDHARMALVWPMVELRAHGHSHLRTLKLTMCALNGQPRAVEPWYTEPVRGRQLAKTDHKRTRIIGASRATRRTHLHVDTVSGAEIADTPCDVDGGERHVRSSI